MSRSRAIRMISLGTIAAVTLTIAGCGKYYRVTDPASGSVYYTRKLDEQRGGAVSFKDEKSGSQVTIQNSEVAEISKDQYQGAVAPE